MFFAKYNLDAKYMSGKLSVLSDPILCRPDYKTAHISRVRTLIDNRIYQACKTNPKVKLLVLSLIADNDAKVERLMLARNRSFFAMRQLAIYLSKEWIW